MGSKGGEMLYSTIAKIEKRTAGIRTVSDKLGCVIQIATVQTAPDQTKP